MVQELVSPELLADVEMRERPLHEGAGDEKSEEARSKRHGLKISLITCL